MQMLLNDKCCDSFWLCFEYRLLKFLVVINKKYFNRLGKCWTNLIHKILHFLS